MCNHISTPDKKKLNEFLEKGIKIEDYDPHYHSSGFKHQEVPVMLMEEPDKVQPVIWGFIPEDASPERASEFQKSAYSLNAKSETIFSQGLYKKAAKNRRCLVFVNGFYEWKHETVGGKIHKIPHYITMPDHKPFALGGLYSHWSDKHDGMHLTTHNILTTPSNELMTTIHNSKKRMPLILDKKDWGIWLDEAATEKDVKGVMKKYPEGFLEARIVALSLKRDLDTDVPEVQRDVQYGGLF